MSEKATTTSPSSRQPGKVGTFHLSPPGEVFDGVTDCGTNAFRDQRICGLERGPYCQRRDAAPTTTSTGLELPPALQLDSGALQLSTRDDQQERQRDDRAEFNGGRDFDQHGHRHGVATVIG